MPTISHQALLLRVLAWHNRHPLARRIKASQVHNIGEVLLPFACAQTQPDAAEPGEWALVSGFGPDLATLSSVALAEGLIEAIAEAPADSAAAPAVLLAMIDSEAPGLAASQDEGEAAIEMPTLDIELSEPPPAESSDELAATADLPTTAHKPAAAEPTATTAPAADEATLALSAHAFDAEPPVSPTEAWPDANAASAPASAAAAASAASKRRGAWLLRWLAALVPGRRSRAAQLQPLFSRSIVWPLSAATIARWGQHHGRPQPVLPADALRRRVEVDAQKVSKATAQGLPQLLHLHVLSASIVDGDRRMRVLMSPTGAVLGSRAYSRPRQASAVALLMVGMLGAGLGLGLGLGGGWPPSGDADGAPGQLVAASPERQAAASDAAAAASPGASSTANAEAHTEAQAEAAHAGAGPAAASAPAAAAVDPAQIATLKAAAVTADSAASAGATSATTSATKSVSATAAATATAPAHAPAASGASLALVRPRLSDQDKRLAREQSARLQADQQVASRQAQAAADLAKSPVYALVSRPSLQRDEALRNLKLMQAARARLAPQAPEQAELVQHQGQWRAAWWPFGNQAEAERARVMLSGRGLRTEMVEF